LGSARFALTDGYRSEVDFGISKYSKGGTSEYTLKFGFARNLTNDQLLLLVRTEPPDAWLLLSSLDVEFLSELLDFFKAYTIYFVRSLRYLRPDRVGRDILCTDADYELFIGVLKAAILGLNRKDIMEKLRSRASEQGFLISSYLLTFLDEASAITELNLPGYAEEYAPLEDEIEEIRAERHECIQRIEAWAQSLQAQAAT
jgi:hypothetical protein